MLNGMISLKSLKCSLSYVCDLLVALYSDGIQLHPVAWME